MDKKVDIEKIKKLSTVEDMFQEEFGPKGTAKKEEFETKARAWYYGQKMQAGIDKYWEENNMGDEDINAILNEHMRTPYSQG